MKKIVIDGFSDILDTGWVNSLQRMKEKLIDRRKL